VLFTNVVCFTPLFSCFCFVVHLCFTVVALLYTFTLLLLFCFTPLFHCSCLFYTVVLMLLSCFTPLFYCCYFVLLLLFCFTPLFYCCCSVLHICFTVVILFYTFVFYSCLFRTQNVTGSDCIGRY